MQVAMVVNRFIVAQMIFRQDSDRNLRSSLVLSPILVRRRRRLLKTFFGINALESGDGYLKEYRDAKDTAQEHGLLVDKKDRKPNQSFSSL